jgi:hypothetical protein
MKNQIRGKIFHKLTFFKKLLKFNRFYNRFTRLFGSFFDFMPNQISSFLFIVILTLITILCMLKLKAPLRQQSDEQITLNASAAAAAAAVAANAAANRSPNIKEHSTFNPYRYFSPGVSTDYLRSRETGACSFSQNKSLNISSHGSPMRGSPQKQSPLNRSQNVPNLSENSMIQSPQRLNTFMAIDRDPVRLFSINADVPNFDSTLFGNASRYDPNRSRNDNEDDRN